MRKFTTVIIAVLLFSAQAQAQLTTEGTDFWFGFMENVQFPNRPVTLEVYVSARQDAQIRLRNASGTFDETRSITANSSVGINVPLNFMALGDTQTSFGLNLTSDVNVSVYALNKAVFTADATVILPTNTLGKEYYVMAHKEPVGDGTGADRNSEMLVVSTEDGTEIEITPSVPTVTGWPAGETRTLTLDRGQTLQIQSTQDLTGTHVQVVENGNTCANIAVFGGNIFTNVGGCNPGGNHDHLFEQMFPVSTWGEEFLWVPYETRSGGDYLKITASEDETVILISGRSNITLDAGETEVIKALTGPRSINSNKPIQAAQLSRSSGCDGQGSSDPFMIMLSPLAQRVTQATFDLFIVDQIDSYYITLITTTTGTAGITLDGADISNRFQNAAGGAYASFELARGTRTIVAPEGVIAYVYGYGSNESFGYAAGVSLENLNVRITGEDPVLSSDVISKEGCINSPIAFGANFEVTPGQPPVFTQFDWDFGDGSTGTGKDTVHIYTEPGTYDITLIASDGNTTCGGNSELIRGTITILDVEVDDPGIVGAISVCPDVDGVLYSISGPAGNTYEWEVDGGTIDGANTGEQIAVNWASANDNAFVRVTPYNALGCPGDPVTLDVKINKRLEPLLPQGNIEVCFTDLGNSVYSTPATAGSEYEWFIEGGVILSGANTNEITVDWEDTGSGRVWYREFNPVITDCEGFSEKLEVVVYGPLVVTETITDVLCNGGSSGAIALNISGGKPGAYTVTWSSTPAEGDLNGIEAGTYFATVRDELGCSVLHEYQVREPEVLSIESPTVDDVRCFQESNGMITVSVTGGTPNGSGDYSYNWTGNGINRNTSVPMVDGLPTGDYTLTVTDANGCTDTEMFFVGEPELLEADLTTLINDPICPDASDGTAFIEAKGGIPDYQFFWSNDPAIDEQLGQNFSQGTYTLRIVDANGCETSIEIEVTERFPRIYLPNAFSPNGDGENDTFKAVTDCNLIFSMQVFNEWGSVAFATSDITEGWDGRVDGKEAPNGKYSYIVFYSGTINGVSFEETQRGTLRLLR